MAILQDNVDKPVPEFHHFGFYWNKDDRGGGCFNILLHVCTAYASSFTHGF